MIEFDMAPYCFIIFYYASIFINLGYLLNIKNQIFSGVLNIENIGGDHQKALINSINIKYLLVLCWVMDVLRDKPHLMHCFFRDFMEYGDKISEGNLKKKQKGTA